MKNHRKRFDWKAIHAELDRRLARLGQTIENDAGRVQEMMRQRSLALAALPRDVRAAKERVRLLIFRLGQERYALRLDCAREITSMSRSAAIPHSGPGILGIINWRGEFVVVFDPAPTLGLPARTDRSQQRVIVLRDNVPPMALAVDGVEEIAQVDPDLFQAREQLHSAHAELFRGATPDSVPVLAEDTLIMRLAEGLRAA